MRQYQAMLNLTTFGAFVACAPDAPAPQAQVAAPANASAAAPTFEAQVQGQPYRAQTRDVCMLNQFNLDERLQFLFSFVHVERDDTLQIGLARGDDRPGPRAITYVLANLGDASFSGVREGSAEITELTRVADGWLVSGRFALALSGSSMASGRPETREATVRDARFERIHCLDPGAILPVATTPAH